MEWPKAANSEQAMAMAIASPALPTLACRSMPESGATNATKAGGAARVDCGSSASLDTIKTDLRGCRLYDMGTPLFRFRDVTSNRGGVTMPTYAPAASSAPDHLVARRRTPLPDGGGRRQHVEIRSPAGPYLRGTRALSQLSGGLTLCVGRPGQLPQYGLQHRGGRQFRDRLFPASR